MRTYFSWPGGVAIEMFHCTTTSMHGRVCHFDLLARLAGVVSAGCNLAGTLRTCNVTCQTHAFAVSSEYVAIGTLLVADTLALVVVQFKREIAIEVALTFAAVSVKNVILWAVRVIFIWASTLASVFIEHLFSWTVVVVRVLLTLALAGVVIKHLIWRTFLDPLALAFAG